MEQEQLAALINMAFIAEMKYSEYIAANQAMKAELDTLQVAITVLLKKLNPRRIITGKKAKRPEEITNESMRKRVYRDNKMIRNGEFARLYIIDKERAIAAYRRVHNSDSDAEEIIKRLSGKNDEIV